MKSRRSAFILVIASALPLLAGPPARGQGSAFTYQGRLVNGATPANGTYDLRFSVYDSSTPAQPPAPALQSVTRSATPVSNGLFLVTLDFGPGIFTGAGRWLEIEVRTNGGATFTTLGPRQAMTPSPYAITAGNLSGPLPASQVTGTLPSSALSGSYSAVVLFDNAANQFFGDGSGLRFGGGFGYCNLPCYWNLSGNAGTVPGLQFLGTTDNQALELHINSQRALRLEPASGSPNLIGGFAGNVVESPATGATIGGGGRAGGVNAVRLAGRFEVTNVPLAATITGGADNSISGSSYGTVGGGLNNRIDESFELAQGMDYNTIGGGAGNRIDLARGSCIAGGTFNEIAGDTGDRVYESNIGGGTGNRIIALVDSVRVATISGGLSNYIDRANRTAVGGGAFNAIFVESDFSTIGGGESNTVNAVSSRATIAGGSRNAVNSRARGAAIGGGEANSISVEGLSRDPQCATIAGGLSNSVWGTLGTIPGGLLNLATNLAFAAGTRAKALHEGAFVWAAGNTHDYPSRATNRAHFYAPGGFEVEYGGQDAAGRGLKRVVLASSTAGRVIEAHNGAFLSEGGVWTDNSDRNAKEHFEPVDPCEILDRVAALPVSRWNYRNESQTVQHLGPVAQDFHAAFALGADDKHIAGLDSAGVALAAIQGLNRKLEEKQAEIDLLKSRLEALEKQLGR